MLHTNRQTDGAEITGAELLAPTPAAAVIGVSTWTLARWRQRGRGPDYVRLGGRIRYRRAALEAWLRSREVRHPSSGVLARGGTA